MKALLRFVRLVVALVIAQTFLTFAGLVVFVSIFMGRTAPPAFDTNTLLRITLSGEIIEYSTLPEVPILRHREESQTDILEALRDAANDPRIEAVLVDLDTPMIGWGKAFELHQAFLEFRESGKPVWGWGASMEEIDLYLGAACDSLFSPPTGMVQIDGIGFGGTYLKGTFDLLGINANFQRTGPYKSAPESYMRDGMSPEARRENEWLLEDIWDEFVDTFIERRGMDGPEFAGLL